MQTLIQLIELKLKSLKETNSELFPDGDFNIKLSPSENELDNLNSENISN